MDLRRSNKSQPITRSVGVSYLSQYLQHLIWTSDISLKECKHLIPFIIVTQYLNQPHPTLQILRHTRLAIPGLFPCKKTGSPAGWASPGNVTSLNCRAVRLCKNSNALFIT
jgi:hypothetical protein